MTRTLVAAAALLIAGGEACALTANGALLTNIACATFSSSSKVGFTVSYCATVPVLILNPEVMIFKSATPTMPCVAGTVTYTLCVINTSATSATNVTVTDKIPWNMAFLDIADEWTLDPATWFTDCRSATGVAPYDCEPVGGAPPAGQASPYYMHWILNTLGPGKSACVIFRATVL